MFFDFTNIISSLTAISDSSTQTLVCCREEVSVIRLSTQLWTTAQSLADMSLKLVSCTVFIAHVLTSNDLDPIKVSLIAPITEIWMPELRYAQIIQFILTWRFYTITVRHLSLQFQMQLLWNVLLPNQQQVVVSTRNSAHKYPYPSAVTRTTCICQMLPWILWVQLSGYDQHYEHVFL